MGGLFTAHGRLIENFTDIEYNDDQDCIYVVLKVGNQINNENQVL